MNILAVDTALSACSVAIFAGGRTVSVFEPMPRGHAEALMPILERALDEADISYSDIDRFAVTVGPGTFTGVRVGVAAVRGFAVATGRPAIAVTTLEALAETARMRGAGPHDAVLVAMDARRDEVYAQVFDLTGPLAEPVPAGPLVTGIDALLDVVPAAVGAVFGSAATAVAEAAGARGRELAVLGTDSAPDPVALVQIARRREAGETPKPFYLRAPDAKPQEAARLARA